MVDLGFDVYIGIIRFLCQCPLRAVAHQGNVEITMGGTNVRIVLRGDGLANEAFTGTAVHHLTAVIGEHVAADAGKLQSFGNRHYPDKGPTGGQDNVGSPCSGFLQHVNGVLGNLFPGVCKGAV